LTFDPVRNISIGVVPVESDLCGRWFFVYTAYKLALSQYPLAMFATMSAVLLIVNIVRLALSTIAFVSLCLDAVSFCCMPLCRNSAWRSLFRNSPLQSAWICLTRCSEAFSSILIISINASVVSSLVQSGFLEIYQE